MIFAGPPPGRVTICHWGEGENQYEEVTLPIPALAGHIQHPEDIIPPTPEFPGLEDGQNWPVGQELWENGCEVAEPTPSPSESLPSTGGWDTAMFLLLFGLTMVALGYLLVNHEGRRR